jgi:hypothetical protein
VPTGPRPSRPTLPPLPLKNLAAYLPVQRYQFPVDRQRGTLPRLLDAGVEAGELGDILSGGERHFGHPVLRNMGAATADGLHRLSTVTGLLLGATALPRIC